MVSNKKEYDILTTPVCAFITFEKDEAEGVALEYSVQGKDRFISNDKIDDTYKQETIFNKIPDFKKATDPTNIIWENRHVKGWVFQLRLYRSFVVIAITLAISMLSIYLLKKETMRMTMKYPAVDCSSVYKVYGTTYEEKMTYAAFEESMHSTGKTGMEGEMQVPSLGSL